MTIEYRPSYVNYNRFFLDNPYVIPFEVLDDTELRYQVFDAAALPVTANFTFTPNLQKSDEARDFFNINTVTVGLADGVLQSYFDNGQFRLVIDRFTVASNEVQFNVGEDLAEPITIAVDKVTKKLQELEYQVQAAVKLFNQDGTPKDQPITNIQPTRIFAIDSLLNIVLAAPTNAVLSGFRGSAGANGIDGTRILTGAAVPTPALGVDGDLYIRSENGSFWRKTNGQWSIFYTVPSGSITDDYSIPSDTDFTIPLGALGDTMDIRTVLSNPNGNMTYGGTINGSLTYEWNFNVGATGRIYGRELYWPDITAVPQPKIPFTSRTEITNNVINLIINFTNVGGNVNMRVIKRVN